MKKRKLKKEYREEMTIYDKEIFGDDNGHEYVCHCYDGHAVCEPRDANDPMLMLSYPTMEFMQSLSDFKELCNYTFECNGDFYQVTPENVTFADIAMSFGKIFAFDKKEIEILKRLFNK